MYKKLMIATTSVVASLLLLNVLTSSTESFQMFDLLARGGGGRAEGGRGEAGRRGEMERRPLQRTPALSRADLGMAEGAAIGAAAADKNTGGGGGTGVYYPQDPYDGYLPPQGNNNSSNN